MRGGEGGDGRKGEGGEEGEGRGGDRKGVRFFFSAGLATLLLLWLLQGFTHETESELWQQDTVTWSSQPTIIHSIYNFIIAHDKTP